MSENLFRKIFLRRKSDVSFIVYGKILLKLIASKVIIFKNKKIIKILPNYLSSIFRFRRFNYALKNY